MPACRLSSVMLKTNARSLHSVHQQIPMYSPSSQICEGHKAQHRMLVLISAECETHQYRPNRIESPAPTRNRVSTMRYLLRRNALALSLCTRSPCRFAHRSPPSHLVTTGSPSQDANNHVKPDVRFHRPRGLPVRDRSFLETASVALNGVQLSRLEQSNST